ncbi:MAG: C25 family cysteine peptidase, partial [Bacteroidales bacterium]
QPSYAKSYEGPIDLIKNEVTYQTDRFYGEPLASIEKGGIMRSMNLATLYIAPIQYNPVAGKMRIYDQLEVEISFVGADLPATYQMKSLHGNGVFLAAESQVINPTMPTNRDEITSAPIKYLIVAHSMFRDQDVLLQFINWKKRIGYLVEVAYTDDANVGTTTTSIKNFIKSHYTDATIANPAPTYLLLIGDVAQIPAFNNQTSETHVTDLYYATWTNGDNFPDCYYGRFSAQNLSQLTPQIDKTLMYEQYTMPDPSYLDKAVLVAGSDSDWSPTHANGQVNYANTYYVNSAYGYSTVYKHLYNSSSQAATIRTEIGEGVGLANYSAHCGSEGWSDPQFENTHVPAMSNQNKYGLMIGNCCLSGKFDDNSCFGETLLRTPNKGAMAYIGASNSSYWNEDYYWAIGVRSNCTANPIYVADNLGMYDKLFHTHDEPYSSWFTSNGAIIMGGNMSVQASTSDRKLYCWEIYHLFGDPSIRTYLTIPDELPVTVNNVLMSGTQSLQVQTVPYAYVALTRNLDLIAAAFADQNGMATLNFSTVLIPGNYELAVSAQNYIQSFKSITVIIPSGPYVIASQVGLSQGSTPKYGNTINIDLEVNNMGVAATNNVYAKISTSSSSVNVTQDSVFIGTLAVNEIKNFANAFSLQIAGNIEDGTELLYDVAIYFAGDTSASQHRVELLAPKVVANDFTVIDALGNNNGVVEPGETVNVSIVVKNTGHAEITNLSATLSSYYTGIVITNATQTINTLNVNSTQTVYYTVQVADTVPEGAVIPLYLITASGQYQFMNLYYLSIGVISEDFETNTFNQFAWTNSSYPWQITNTGAYAGSYCARSTNNLSHNQKSELSITLNVLADGEISYYRKVSSELDYDLFSFYIDGEMQEELSGTVNWGKATFPVSAGTHTFKFEYAKDFSASGGSDCAWIDNVSFPVTGALVPMAGVELTVMNYEIDNVVEGKLPVNTLSNLTIRYANVGNKDAHYVKARLTTTNPDLLMNGQKKSLETLVNSIAAGENTSSDYSLNLKSVSQATTTVDLIFSLITPVATIDYPFTLTFGAASMNQYTSFNYTIYPNPTTQNLNIITEVVLDKLEILDISGKII